MTSAPRASTAIFAKRPTAGAVKTRLCPPLTLDAAAWLADAMLADTVEKCARSRAFATSIWIESEGSRSWFEARFSGVAIEVQRGDGLGARLAEHFERVLGGTRGAQTAVCVGADSPHVPVDRIAGAHARLAAGADVVLGPDDGGGYYLVGLRDPAPELFTQVEMSTVDMCARTVELARARGLSVELLERDYDVDGPADLARLAATCESVRAARVLVHTRRALSELAPLLR